jgi:hypothetical protein
MNGKQARKLRKLAEHTSGAKDLKGKTHGVRQRNMMIPLAVDGRKKLVPGYIKYQAITIVNIAKQNYNVAKKAFRRLKLSGKYA